MELISNLPCDTRSRYGHLILVCLDCDEKKTQSLQSELHKAGYPYLFFSISEDALARRDFLPEIIRALNSCSCLIPVISDNLFKEEATICRNVFWFIIGYMRSKCSNGFVPYLIDGDGLRLSITPLKNENLSTSSEYIVKTLENKYSKYLMKSHYYDNYLLNYYAYKRITYRRVKIKCHIYEDAFKHICKAMEYEWGNDSETMLDQFLASKLFCAYRVLSFGADTAVEPQCEPYRNEIHLSENAIAASTSCNTVYTVLSPKHRISNGVHAEIDIDTILPVHRLFGVYFKFYLSIKEKDYFWMLPVLFSRDLTSSEFSILPDDEQIEDESYWSRVFSKETHLDFKNGNLYFGLGLEGGSRENTLKLTSKMGVGSTADYIFPQ